MQSLRPIEELDTMSQALASKIKKENPDNYYGLGEHIYKNFMGGLVRAIRKSDSKTFVMKYTLERAEDHESDDHERIKSECFLL